MKKIVVGTILAALAFSASAEYNPNHHPRHTTNSMIHGRGWVGPQHHHHHHARGHGWGWVVPAVIGGAVVYAATRPQVVEQQIIVQQPPTDVVYINGIAYRKQIMVVNGQYQEVLVRL